MSTNLTIHSLEGNQATLPYFALIICNNIKKVLELGAGHGRDSIFFPSNGLEVEALDYSAFAVELLNKTTKEKRLPLKPHLFDVKHQLTYPDGYFDAAYSHMLLNMRFSLEELHFIFSDPEFRVRSRKYQCIKMGTYSK